MPILVFLILKWFKIRKTRLETISLRVHKVLSINQYMKVKKYKLAETKLN